ncbi:MAG TPA: alpha/beta fold hydrolase [Dehalococcoidia bacterium]|nr:alpha/beta fold hydrolase [Dehalococcoidia bacterium]
MFAAGYCPPPGERVVVFVQGLYTSLEDGQTGVGPLGERRFATLRQAFRDAGFPDERLLDFSYAGGRVDDAGRWVPEDYGCLDTDRPTEASVDRLDAMLRAYREAHPKAGFVLVGHSLGGYIAFELAEREAARTDKVGLSAVVTIDAPLLGASADKQVVLDLVECDGKTYAAGADLVRLASDPAAQEAQRAAARAIRADAIRLATIGNANDCLYYPTPCGLPGPFVDDRATQTLEGADLALYGAIASGPFESHEIATAYAPYVDAIVRFAGPP